MQMLDKAAMGMEKKLFMIGAIILAFFVFMALFAPVIAPYDPHERVGAPFSSPSGSHLLGTNDLGQDIFSEVVFGSRISIIIGILTASIAVGMGCIVGIIAGYFRGRGEGLLMRFTDLILVIPFLPLIIVVAAYLGSGLFNLIIIMGLVMWPATARIIRSQVIKVNQKEYIMALRAMGASTVYILRKHMIWEITPFLIYRFMLTASYAILIEASLSFLGLGTPLSKSWGNILFYAQARNAMLTDAWLWWIIPPGLCIALLAVSFLLLGFYMESRANPRLGR
jgi:peptide/nickel transport system ATP-binding protein/peptide/nickel transport system permease protein